MTNWATIIAPDDRAASVGDCTSYVVIALVVATFSYSGAVALSGLFGEVKFYLKNGWDMKLDSGKSIFRQHQFIRRFGFLQVGTIKLLYYSAQVCLALIIVIPIIRSAIALVDPS